MATGRAATQGVLVRDAAAIECLRTVDTLIVDKTGTLTAGKPAFDRAVPVEGGQVDEVIRLAASLNQGSGQSLVDATVQAEVLRSEGASVVDLTVEGMLLGLLAVSDPMKAS